MLTLRPKADRDRIARFLNATARAAREIAADPQAGWADFKSYAPELDDAAKQSIDAMLDAEVPEKTPTDEECHRHYDANHAQFTVGQALKMRHILFAVTTAALKSLFITSDVAVTLETNSSSEIGW